MGVNSRLVPIRKGKNAEQDGIDTKGNFIMQMGKRFLWLLHSSLLLSGQTLTPAWLAGDASRIVNFLERRYHPSSGIRTAGVQPCYCQGR
jgi:hypothetical protein